MKRPSFQFYPTDWTGNAKLRLAQKALKGTWIDCMCFFHDSEEEYGIARCSLKDLASGTSSRLSDLMELRRRGILKGADAGEQFEGYVHTPRHAGKDGKPVTLIPAQPGPVWYSSRMVLDEWRRGVRGASTRFPPSQPPTARQGDNHAEHQPGGKVATSRTPTHGSGPGPTSSSSSKNGVNNTSPTRVDARQNLLKHPPGPEATPESIAKGKRIAALLVEGKVDEAKKVKAGLA